VNTFIPRLVQLSIGKFISTSVMNKSFVMAKPLCIQAAISYRSGNECEYLIHLAG